MPWPKLWVASFRLKCGALAGGVFFVAGLALLLAVPLHSQTVGTGTVSGTVLDPSQMVVPQAYVELRNPVTGYMQTVKTDDTGAFHFDNVPQNMYEISITATGFAAKRQPLEVSNAAPISLSFTLQMGEVATSVDVNASMALIDTDPSAHTDTGSSAFMKLPILDAASGLSSIINNSTGGTAADANGFFHPLGDHAQVSFVIDGQTDQRSAEQSLLHAASAQRHPEHGADHRRAGRRIWRQIQPGRERDHKIGTGRPAFRQPGSFNCGLVWNLFEPMARSAWGTAKFGNFLAVNGIRTGHFLDTPEFLPIHDIGNNETIFDRVDCNADRPRRLPFESLRGAQLVPGSQQLRSVVARIRSSASSPGISPPPISIPSDPRRC